MPRRTQAERSEATTTALLATARTLFGQAGYTATSLDAVAAGAGVTKGALYHHFKDKKGLFRAAFVAEQQGVTTRLEAVAAAHSDIWQALRQGIRTFLEHCLDPCFRRIVLLDAPHVLGWETVREIEHAYVLRVLRTGLEAAHSEGRLATSDVTVSAHLLFGTVCEAGMLLARHPAPSEALPTLVRETGRLLSALDPAPRRP
ncbi:TetR/AcrR family transcriptional regulator [Actinocorallia sp. B10E7]|uniref:TetR/AcrR family transcriptional regulator n=1 Tax=Actinocorallia sp. B10E7 TaxID=3153558 RepID=UPI00325EC069